MSEDTIPQMRERIDTQAAEIQTRDSTISELQSELRASQAREAFRDAGYNPKHGSLYAQQNPDGDITEESVAAFAGEWDLTPASPSAPTEEVVDNAEASDGSEALDSLDRSGSRAGSGGDGSSSEQVLTRQEWIELQLTDPVAAASAMNQGRVQLGEDPTAGAPRGTNPYDQQS